MELQKLKLKKILFAVGLPYIIYLFHVSLFGNWIIDDAGISFAYSRNLAEGYGLVSQPGSEPVEGYSSLAWVLLFVPFLWLKLFAPVFIPKLLSILIILVSFITLYKTIRLISANSPAITLVCLILLSLNTAFVVWTSSGLENPLYVLLVLFLLNRIIKLSLSLNYKNTIVAAVIASLIAMTRPDGILFMPIPLIFFLFNYIFWNESKRTSVENFFLYTLIFALTFGSFLIFRFYYFGDLFPNTYYAKGGPSYADLKDLLLLEPKMYLRVSELFGSTLSFWGDLFFLGLIITTTYFISVRRFTKQHFIVMLFWFFQYCIPFASSGLDERI